MQNPPPPPTPPPPPPPGGSYQSPPSTPSVYSPPPAPMQYAAPQYQGPQPTYAGFWIRLVARLIDGLILGIPFGIVFGVFAVAGGVFANNASTSSQDTQNAAAAAFGGVFLLLYLLALVVQVGYWIYFWGSSGSTLGMRLLHLKIVDANTGGPIGYGRATARFLMSIVNTWACYIGWIWVAFDPRKQGWHDKVANSVVLQS